MRDVRGRHASLDQGFVQGRIEAVFNRKIRLFLDLKLGNRDNEGAGALGFQCDVVINEVGDKKF